MYTHSGGIISNVVYLGGTFSRMYTHSGGTNSGLPYVVHVVCLPTVVVMYVVVVSCDPHVIRVCNVPWYGS